MKKTYEKPEVYFESFELSTSIAAGCETVIKTSTQGACPYVTDSGRAIFTDTVTACTTKSGDTGTKYGCYHVPIDTNNIFNSL